MDDLLEVRLRLQGARQFIADTVASAKSVSGFGVASEEAAAKTKLTNAEAFALRQGLFTLRRELFYGTAAVGAFAAETIKLGFSFDEARQQGVDAFTAITGSQRLANQEMVTLINLSEKSGVQLATLGQSAITMQGFGADLHDVNVELAALANFAQRAGLGSGGLASLVDIFDRIRQSGKLTSLDIRTLTGLGVPALGILSRQLHLTGAQTRGLQAGKLIVPSSLALPALTAGIGARADQLGTNLGQQLGITHSYLGQILGGKEGGLFSFATGGLERVNAALKSRSNGGSFLQTLDPSGSLLTGWRLLGAAVSGVVTPLTVVVHLFMLGARTFPFIGGALGFLARQTWLVRTAMIALSTWYLITRTRMLLFMATTKAVGVAETAYLGLLYLLDAATALLAGDFVAMNVALEATPIGWIITLVATLAFGLYELVKHADQVGHAFVVAFDAVKYAVKDALNFIIGGWDWLADKLTLPGVSVFGHRIGGGSLLPHIPKLDTGGYVSQTGLAVVHRGETWSGVGPYAQRVGDMPPIELHVYLDGDEITASVVKTSSRRIRIANGVAQAQQLAGVNA